MTKTYTVALAAVSLTVCAAAQPQTPQAPSMPANSTAYTIDPAQSEVRLLVFHGGKIGHNHVIVNRHVGGQVNFTGAVDTSSFALTLPVMDFDVDDANARSEEATEGSDFAKAFSADDRAGTKEHMLEPKLLDGAHFAEITLSSTAVTGTPEGFTATMAVKVAGHSSTLVVPFSLTNMDGRLSATGTTHLRQTELGLKPLSFMMGAFTVQDEITVKFKLVAMAASGK